nr:MAG TPA: hypothetical protein [Caudoviricetes sp.]
MNLPRAAAAWLLIVFGIIRSEFPAIHQFIFLYLTI